MIVDLFKGVLFLGKHAWPFVREWLFKSKTLKAWLKKHAAQLFYFVLICIMMFVCYSLFVAIAEAHKMRSEAVLALQKMTASHNALLLETQNDRATRTKQAATIKALGVQTHEQAVMIETYQNWMTACGMPYSNIDALPYPTCRGSRTYRPPTPQVSKPTTAQPKPKPKRPKPKPLPKPESDLNKQVQDLWGNKP